VASSAAIVAQRAARAGSASITYFLPVGAGASRMSFTPAAPSYVGSRYTQIDDETPGIGTVNIAPFGAKHGWAAHAGHVHVQSAYCRGYTLVNLRVGLSRSTWEAAVFLNNLTNEQALLALDRERGLRARVGYLVNQPRTMGISVNFNY